MLYWTWLSWERDYQANFSHTSFIFEKADLPARLLGICNFPHQKNHFLFYWQIKFLLTSDSEKWCKRAMYDILATIVMLVWYIRVSLVRTHRLQTPGVDHWLYTKKKKKCVQVFFKRQKCSFCEFQSDLIMITMSLKRPTIGLAVWD